MGCLIEFSHISNRTEEQRLKRSLLAIRLYLKLFFSKQETNNCPKNEKKVKSIIWLHLDVD